MPNITWKAAIAGGAVAGVSLGGFAVAQDDQPLRPVDNVQLRLVSANLAASPSAPVTVASSASKPVRQNTSSPAAPAAVVPAPAPVVPAVASAPSLPDICPGGDFTGSSWDDSCGIAPPPPPPPPPPVDDSPSPDSPAPAPAPAAASDSPASPPSGGGGGGSGSGGGSAGS